jgi:hypothetical protein
MRHPAIPWTLTVLLGLWVFALEYYAKHQSPPDPSIAFYDTTEVTAQVHTPEAPPAMMLYAQFNNILEGKRQWVSAKGENGRYRLRFEVNSPRPAVLYTNDEPLEIFLVPGDTTLHVDLYWTAPYDHIDSVHFSGQNAKICEYFQAKAAQFEQVHLRATRHTVASVDLRRYGNKLDSMAAQELAFLAEKEVFSFLPTWFGLFEKNEILYQRAYLKLAAAYNREVDPSLLDHPPVNNQGAVFSYYYYLYLNAYFAQLQGDSLPAVNFKRQIEQHMALADSLLTDGPRDVFMTRVIIQSINEGRQDLARQFFLQYRASFSRPKYARFLEAQLEKGADQAE